ncbi:Myoneurin [Trichinella nativa]|uniref:Myoneurin n=1 Tax=Trichinella nativa TaxID=6335 RepID=A0A0V1L7Q5_9BILA|nr:Myoneurin [Trichinella nativa]
MMLRCACGRFVESSFSFEQSVIFCGHSGHKKFHRRILFEHRTHFSMETNRFCQLCNKQFSTSYQYKMHMNIHLGIKPFVCEICGSRFNNVGTRHNHMRRHSNASPFACPLCEKTFAWELSLKEHLQSHANHGDIKASMVKKIYEQQKRQCRPNRRAKNRRGFRMTDPMMLQQSLPENGEGVSLPTVNYVIYHNATAYNPNTSLVAKPASENQHPQLQQQILFHDNGEFYQNGHSSSVANQPYNGRHEMINAENTAKNDIQCRTNYGTSTNAGFGNVFFNRNMRDQNESNPFPTAGNNVGK